MDWRFGGGFGGHGAGRGGGPGRDRGSRGGRWSRGGGDSRGGGRGGGGDGGEDRQRCPLCNRPKRGRQREGGYLRQKIEFATAGIPWNFRAAQFQVKPSDVYLLYF